MNKSKTVKTLTGGSVKQRALLLVENIARLRSGVDPILTKSEGDKIWDSFKTPYEKKTWNNIRAIGEAMLWTVNVLQAIGFEVLWKKSNLRGSLSLWGSYEQIEELSNLILYEIKDPEERKRIAEIISKRERILLGDLSLDSESYLKLTIRDKSVKGGIADIIQIQRQKLIESYQSYNGAKKAISDYEEETGVYIKIYREKIEKLDKTVSETNILDTKYLYNSKYTGREKVIMEDYIQLPDPEEAGYSQEAYDKIMRNLKAEGE